MKALLLTGLQVDLLPGGPAEVPESDLLLPVINNLIEKFDLVIAANFSMPANHVVFAGNHPWRYPGQTLEIGGSPTLLQPIFCVPGTFGSEFIPGLRATLIADTFLMGMQADIPPYSAFSDVDMKHSTGLQQFLKMKKVTELYIAGIPFETTVTYSALDSQAAGFGTLVIEDACKGRDTALISEAKHKMVSAGIRIITADKLD